MRCRLCLIDLRIMLIRCEFGVFLKQLQQQMQMRWKTKEHRYDISKLQRVLQLPMDQQEWMHEARTWMHRSNCSCSNSVANYLQCWLVVSRHKLKTMQEWWKQSGWGACVYIISSLLFPKYAWYFETVWVQQSSFHGILKVSWNVVQDDKQLLRI